MNKLEKSSSFTNQTFEDIKHIDEEGIEYWNARELQIVLNYKEIHITCVDFFISKC